LLNGFIETAAPVYHQPLHRLTTPLLGVFAQAFSKKACAQAVF